MRLLLIVALCATTACFDDGNVIEPTLPTCEAVCSKVLGKFCDAEDGTCRCELVTHRWVKCYDTEDD